MRLLSFFGLMLLLTLTSFDDLDAHKYYFSRTEIHQNVQSNAMEITISIFSDDLENALQDQGEPLRLGDEREREDVNNLLREYLQSKFTVKTDGRPLLLSFLGKEVEHDITYCYLEVMNVPSCQIMEIKSTILHELFEEQLNRVEINWNGKSTSGDLTRSRSTLSIDF